MPCRVCPVESERVLRSDHHPPQFEKTSRDVTLRDSPERVRSARSPQTRTGFGIAVSSLLAGADRLQQS